VDVQQKLDEIVSAVDGARSMPMSASCVVNRAELLAMLSEVREALPGSLAQAEELLGGREQMVAEAQAEAQRIIESGHVERGSMVSGTEVVRMAQQEADQILAQARQEAEEIRAEADDYVDSKLANFEVVLSKTIGSVERGREKLLGSGPGSEEWNEDYAEDAPERSTDPRELRERADGYVDARLGSVAAVLTKTLEAVGRGRQKLLGHRPADELGAHMLAQDEAGDQAPHTSDADYLAGLASLGDPDQAAAPRESARPEGEPAVSMGVPGGIPEQPTYHQAAGADQYAMTGQAQQQDPYDPYQMAAQQAQQQEADAYAMAQQQESDAYNYQQNYAYYGQQDPYYGQQQGVYDPYQAQQQMPMPQDPHDPALLQQQMPQPQLDETSFFDTSMIDLEQVRQYEEQYGQGPGYGHT
jgi:hypothetical protein